MEIEELRHGAVTVLRPKGPLGEQDTEQLVRRATEVLGRSLGRFVIDASEVAYVDSAGLEALVQIGELLAPTGQTLKLCKATETLREVLDLTGLRGEFEHYDDVQMAVRAFL